MVNLTNKSESLINLSIIIIAISICLLLIKAYLSKNPDNPHSDLRTLVPIDWANNGQTLLLALESSCHHCSESAPFYQRIAQKRGNTKLVAVLPEPVRDGQKYLNDLGVAVDDVEQADFSSIGIKGTPTLLLVNDKGDVTHVWIGKLPPEQELAVLSQILAR